MKSMLSVKWMSLRLPRNAKSLKTKPISLPELTEKKAQETIKYTTWTLTRRRMKDTKPSSGKPSQKKRERKLMKRIESNLLMMGLIVSTGTLLTNYLQESRESGDCGEII